MSQVSAGNLTNEDLDQVIDELTTGTPKTIDDCTKVQLRHVSYRKQYRFYYGIGKRGRKYRVKLPLCVVNAIWNIYKEENMPVEEFQTQ